MPIFQSQQDAPAGSEACYAQRPLTITAHAAITANKSTRMLMEVGSPLSSDAVRKCGSSRIACCGGAGVVACPWGAECALVKGGCGNWKTLRSRFETDPPISIF